MTIARGLHHVELWVVDLDEARREWGWLLERLGYELDGEWDEGSTWILGDTYLTFTVSPRTAGRTVYTGPRRHLAKRYATA